MNIYVEIKDERGNVSKHTVNRGILARYVVSEKLYPVSYMINDGKKIKGAFHLKGHDLTENQIAELFVKGLL